jgi:predicted enzyme related to lactoylglutathione lyase
MSSTQLSSDTAADASAPASVALRLEVTALPVADVDRAKAFYEGLGWRLDADVTVDEHYRVVQFTPRGSPASIILGQGTTTMAPGSVQDLMLIVDDLDAARDELIRRGGDVSDVWHDTTGIFHHAGAEGRVSGRDPKGRSYGSWASFSDPRPRRERLAAAGDHAAAPGPGVIHGRCGTCRAPARDGRPSRLVRGSRPSARLVRLVRGVHGRTPARKRSG